MQLPLPLADISACVDGYTFRYVKNPDSYFSSMLFLFYNFILVMQCAICYLLHGLTFIYISQPSPYLDFMCCGVPIHLKLPLTIIPNLVDRAQAYYIECVVRMMVDCFFQEAMREMIFHMKRRALGSMPVDGQSRKMMLGLPIIAMATDNFLLLPPDNVPDNLSSYYSKFISLIFCVTASSLYSAGNDFKSQNISNCSLTVRF